MPENQVQSKPIDGLFIVDLRSLNLPQKTQEDIEKAIQTAVMAALAEADNAPRSFGGMWRPETMGMVPDFPDRGQFNQD